MNQRVSVIPVKRKSDLKKVMSGMETAGSAVIINPLQANNAELAVETYFFNEALSSSVYPDSVPLIKLQRIGETVLILAGGKVSKAVIENIAVAYYSSSSTSNFFIPVEIPFEHFYNTKNIYLYHAKTVIDLSTINGKTVKDAQLSDNRIYVINEDKEVLIADLNSQNWQLLPIKNANTLTVNSQNEVYIATDDGVYNSDISAESGFQKLDLAIDSKIYDVGVVGDVLILSEDKHIIKSAVKDNGKWQITGNYSCLDKTKLFLIGYSDFFGGLAMVTADKKDFVDTMKFLTIPGLKELQHPRHVRS